MASLTSSSRRASSSYRSSARYSTSSSYCTEGSLGGSSDSLDTILDTGVVVRCLGDSYYMSADVSQFEPHDVVVLAYNQHVVIHAQKVLDDGSISDTFTHKSLFPEDMDPLSVSGTLNPDGTLVVSVRQKSALTGNEHLGIPITLIS
uniref:SHSP domain-containing protein n=1 Tax=Pundamilia nyererei TaxID=303518 RepID=A0A3B4FWS6_9CICH